MFFKVSNNEELPLQANDVDLQERWWVMGPSQMEEVTESKWSWFYYVQNRVGERTKPHLVYDEVIGRVGIVKTVFYRPEDLQNEQKIQERRLVLREQIEILNKVKSPLLPEPLDWFEVTNTVDGLPEPVRLSEPALVLDYVPGFTLAYINEKQRLRFYGEGGGVDTPRVGRLSLNILRFLRILEEQGYAYLDLNPNHVLLLNNDAPRFIGIGSICAVRDGHLDPEHVNFGRTSKGYAAPELNDPDRNWGEDATPKQIGAFSLGVLLHQMVYESNQFEPGTLRDGSFFYPNGVTEKKILKEKDGELIHELIQGLCQHNPDERLVDFDEIERQLQNIALSIDSDRYQDRKQESERRRQEKEKQKELARQARLKTGRVKFYDQIKGFGFIACADVAQDVFVHASALEKNKINRLLEGTRVRFEMRVNSSGRHQARDLEILPEAASTLDPRAFLRSQVRSTSAPPPQPVKKKKKTDWCFLSTAAYGTATEPKLDTLRWFRDEVLRPRTFGRQLLAHYAKTSPRISRRLDRMGSGKRWVRGVIDVSVLAVKHVQESEGKGWSFGLWTSAAVLIYFAAYALAYGLTRGVDEESGEGVRW